MLAYHCQRVNKWVDDCSAKRFGVSVDLRKRYTTSLTPVFLEHHNIIQPLCSEVGKRRSYFDEVCMKPRNVHHGVSA
ncbi:hypothetical protein CHARACLAT_024656 [Characodon lateralis]|uniref:Uncharacterized protein n=1 Tax=Characodon lateralis TaxID=208331 RepID=A0ABU7D0J1_9TELE|nr:hypothetical protein [Characodon lateralis]